MPLVWYEGTYKISTLWNVIWVDREVNGRIVWTTKKVKWKVKTIRLDKYGYPVVVLCKNWHQNTKTVHRLVAKAFIPNAENKTCVNHKNGIKTDNRVENLEWCTISENAIHSIHVLRNETWLMKNKPQLWKFWKEHNRSKYVKQFNLNWFFIKEWWSLMDIQRNLWFNAANIYMCCVWRVKKSHGYIRKYN